MHVIWVAVLGHFCFRTVLRKEALDPCIVGKYQKKVEFYGYPNLFFPTT
jgi:hypothetical protein